MTPLPTDQSVYGKLYYDTGELKYEGYYTPIEHDATWYEPMGKGTFYYKNGVVFRKGQFQHGGLLEGKEFYPSGKLKFEGRYNCRKTDGHIMARHIPFTENSSASRAYCCMTANLKSLNKAILVTQRLFFPKGLVLLSSSASLKKSR